MYGENDKIDNAKKYLHMTMDEAMDIAVANRPKEVWLTHFSPSENAPQMYEKNLRKKYKETYIFKDGNKKVYNFE